MGSATAEAAACFKKLEACKPVLVDLKVWLGVKVGFKGRLNARAVLIRHLDARIIEIRFLCEEERQVIDSHDMMLGG